VTTLVIHAGGGKCGSSALQKCLSSLANPFDKYSSIYYGPNRVSSHTFLLSLVDPKKYLRLRGVSSVLLAERSSDRYLESLREFSGAQYVVVSSEFFAGLSVDKFNLLISLLAKQIRFSSIKIILYVRPPDSLYLSRAQQRLKADSVITPFFTFSCDYSSLTRLRHIECDEIVLREFSRSSLIGGDIIEDFFSVAFGMEPWHNLRKIILDTTVTNESLSAESMCALQVYNTMRVSSGLSLSMGSRSKRIVNLLRDFDAGHAKMINKPSLQAFISTFLILSHMPALKKAFQEYGVFGDLVKEYNRNISPVTVINSGYFFSGRGSSFEDIRSVLLRWDDQLVRDALGYISSSDN